MILKRTKLQNSEVRKEMSLVKTGLKLAKNLESVDTYEVSSRVFEIFEI